MEPTLSWKLRAALGRFIPSFRQGRNYPDAAGPRYHQAGPAGGPGTAKRLRIVTFNIEFSRRIAGAIGLLQSDPALVTADVLLLQEMHPDGVDKVADALGMGYVYYPACFHGHAEQDFGNAVLARLPIEGDAKLVLPHPSRMAGTYRTATVATVRVGDLPVRVYCTHLGTPLDVSAARRREQLAFILADAAPHPRVVIGGDLNDSGVGAVAAAAGYAWPTREGPRTTALGRWDHLFFKGLDAPETGTGPDARGVSDHRPVWAVGVLT